MRDAMSGIGESESGYKAIRSGLDIQSPTLVNYSKMKQSVSTQLMVLSKDIIRENVEAEVKAKPGQTPNTLETAWMIDAA
jgi:putative N-acetylmannosamine-6-phosphate epimerase